MKYERAAGVQTDLRWNFGLSVSVPSSCQTKRSNAVRLVGNG